MLERLQKIMSQAGVASRRECEDMILHGRVKVDGKLMNVLGTKVDPNKQVIEVDGTKLKVTKKEYMRFYKPKGMHANTRKDRTENMRELVQQFDTRMAPLGHSDYDMEGLVILTSDGSLIDRVAKGKNRIREVWEVHLKGDVDREQIRTLRYGVKLSDGKAKLHDITFKASKVKGVLVLVCTFTQRLPRMLPRAFSAVGLKVHKMVRVKYDGVSLGRMRPGDLKPLRREDRDLLLNAQTPAPKGPAKAKAKPRVKPKVRPKRA